MHPDAVSEREREMLAVAETAAATHTSRIRSLFLLLPTYMIREEREKETIV